MNLYTEKDSNLLVERVEEIIKNADEISSKIVKPTVDDLWEIIFTVRDFVKEKKRKIYGGFALNKLIEDINPADKFYLDEDIKSWDIDFYSPDPIGDAKEIANRLSKKGFIHVQAREAQHDETYKVFAETKDCADISYVPKNIYNKMPFKEVNGLCLTGPHFMMIDYFRVMTDPLTSYFRLEKTFTRLCLMLKYYPLPKNTSSIDIVPPDRDLDIAFHTVHDFLKDKTSTIVVGLYAYNHLIRESGIIDNAKLIKRSKGGPYNKNTKRTHNDTTKIDYIDINYYEVVSTQYKRDARDLILDLQNKFPTSGVTRVTYRENYPFFQYLGYSVDVLFDDEIICRMYHYNSRCTPYFDVPAYYFKKSDYEDTKGTIRIGSFATLMMFNLINVMRARTNNDNNTKNLYYTLISHMIELKNYYFARTKKTIFDVSLFQEFILRCVGETTTAQMEKQTRVEKKIKAGKKYSWSFNPLNERDRNNDARYQFKNSSGNPINNDKNMKIDLSENILDDDIDNINDEEDNDSVKD
jgi:hypothetical protein